MSLPKIHANFSLRTYNTFAVEAYAKYFCRVRTVDELSNLHRSDIFSAESKFVLGEGSNTLFVQDYDGLVIQNAMDGLQHEKVDDETVLLTVGAGVNWHTLVLYAIENELYGIENLSLIPGTVGAAPIQNIGAYGVELRDVFHSLNAFDLKSGVLNTMDLAQCKFGYRDSVFKNSLKNRVFVTTVRLLLSTKPKFNLSYYALHEALGSVVSDQLTLKMVSDAVIEIRNSKLPDPKRIPNAGSFFKNPIVPVAQYHDLKTRFEQLPSFVVDESRVKIPAAWLIDQCGWKGKRVGSVGVHDQQALVLVNQGQGNGADILALAERIQHDVNQKFDIKLTPEVGVIK